jgi:hypothetical protein
MPAYAVAHMRRVTMGPPIVEYLERIDATLAPFGGHFIVHGGDFEQLEGSWPGNLIVIEFPDREQGPCLVRLGRLPGDRDPAHGQLRQRCDHDRRGRPRPQGHRRARLSL